MVVGRMSNSDTEDGWCGYCAGEIDECVMCGVDIVGSTWVGCVEHQPSGRHLHICVGCAAKADSPD